MTLETRLDENEMKDKLLNYFDTEEDAKQAAEDYAKELFGVKDKSEKF